MHEAAAAGAASGAPTRGSSSREGCPGRARASVLSGARTRCHRGNCSRRSALEALVLFGARGTGSLAQGRASVLSGGPREARAPLAAPLWSGNEQGRTGGAPSARRRCSRLSFCFITCCVFLRRLSFSLGPPLFVFFEPLAFRFLLGPYLSHFLLFLMSSSNDLLIDEFCCFLCVYSL